MSIAEKILKEFGVTIDKYMSNVVMSDEYQTIPVSPRIDITCGGGIKEGSVVLVSGDEKLGKSTLCLQAIASAQQIKDKVERKAFYFDIENKLLPRDLQIDGLDTSPDKFIVIGSSAGELLTGENVFRMIEKLVATHTNCIFVIDSVSMLLSEDELNYTFDKTFRADIPRLTSIFLRKIVQLLRPSKNTLFCILQKMANQNASGPMAPQTKEGGGKKMQYVGNYKFALTYKEIERNKEEKITGHKVHFKCVFHPSSDVETNESHFYHTFGRGIDAVREYVDLAQDCGLIQKAASWFKLNDGSKIQGFDKLVEYYRKNPEELEAIKEQLRDLYHENKDDNS